MRLFTTIMMAVAIGSGLPASGMDVHDIHVYNATDKYIWFMVRHRACLGDLWLVDYTCDARGMNPGDHWDYRPSWFIRTDRNQWWGGAYIEISEDDWKWFDCSNDNYWTPYTEMYVVVHESNCTQEDVTIDQTFNDIAVLLKGR